MTAETPIDTVGIIGAGSAGQAFARVAQRASRKVVIANSHGPQSLAAVVDDLGAGVSAGTVGEAAASAMVVIAVPWASVPEAVANQAWEAKIVVDQTNPYIFPEMKLADLGGRSSSEIVAELVEGARVVKAANTLGAGLLGSDPHEAGGRRVLFLSGDDGAAKAVVADLFEGAGFFPIDLGDLATGGPMQQAGGPLPGLNLVRLP